MALKTFGKPGWSSKAWSRRWVLMGLVMCLSWPKPSLAQFGSIVHDPTNYIPILNTYRQAIQEVRLAEQDLSELSGIVDDTEEWRTQAQQVLQAVLTIAQGLAWRYGRWRAMLPVAAQIPCTLQGLVDWNRQYDVETSAAIVAAGEAQTLLSSSAGSLQGLVNTLASVIAGVVGSVSGLQGLHGQLARLVGLTVNLQAMQAPYQDVQIREKMREQVTSQSDEILSYNRMSGLYGVPKKMCEPFQVPN